MLKNFKKVEENMENAKYIWKNISKIQPKFRKCAKY